VNVVCCQVEVSASG